MATRCIQYYISPTWFNLDPSGWPDIAEIVPRGSYSEAELSDQLRANLDVMVGNLCRYAWEDEIQGNAIGGDAFPNIPPTCSSVWNDANFVGGGFYDCSSNCSYNPEYCNDVASYDPIPFTSWHFDIVEFTPSWNDGRYTRQEIGLNPIYANGYELPEDYYHGWTPDDAFHSTGTGCCGENWHEYNLQWGYDDDWKMAKLVGAYGVDDNYLQCCYNDARGCTDPDAINYDPTAAITEGCQYEDLQTFTFPITAVDLEFDEDWYASSADPCDYVSNPECNEYFIAYRGYHSSAPPNTLLPDWYYEHIAEKIAEQFCFERGLYVSEFNYEAFLGNGYADNPYYGWTNSPMYYVTLQSQDGVDEPWSRPISVPSTKHDRWVWKYNSSSMDQDRHTVALTSITCAGVLSECDQHSRHVFRGVNHPKGNTPDGYALSPNFGQLCHCADDFPNKEDLCNSLNVSNNDLHIAYPHDTYYNDMGLLSAGAYSAAIATQACVSLGFPGIYQNDLGPNDHDPLGFANPIYPDGAYEFYTADHEDNVIGTFGGYVPTTDVISWYHPNDLIQNWVNPGGWEKFNETTCYNPYAEFGFGNNWDYCPDWHELRHLVCQDPVYGCTDGTAYNFNQFANVQSNGGDGSVCYPIIPCPNGDEDCGDYWYCNSGHVWGNDYDQDLRTCMWAGRHDAHGSDGPDDAPELYDILDKYCQLKGAEALAGCGIGDGHCKNNDDNCAGDLICLNNQCPWDETNFIQRPYHDCCGCPDGTFGVVCDDGTRRCDHMDCITYGCTDANACNYNPLATNGNPNATACIYASPHCFDDDQDGIGSGDPVNYCPYDSGHENAAPGVHWINCFGNSNCCADTCEGEVGCDLECYPVGQIAPVDDECGVCGGECNILLNQLNGCHLCWDGTYACSIDQCPEGCTDPLAWNYDYGATAEAGNCQYYGCTNPTSVYYFCNLPENINAYPCTGAYEDLLVCDDLSCVGGDQDTQCGIHHGCTDLFALNYDPIANVDNGSCQYKEDLICCLDSNHSGECDIPLHVRTFQHLPGHPMPFDSCEEAYLVDNMYSSVTAPTPEGFPSCTNPISNYGLPVPLRDSVESLEAIPAFADLGFSAEATPARLSNYCEHVTDGFTGEMGENDHEWNHFEWYWLYGHGNSTFCYNWFTTLEAGTFSEPIALTPMVDYIDCTDTYLFSQLFPTYVINSPTWGPHISWEFPISTVYREVCEYLGCEWSESEYINWSYVSLPDIDELTNHINTQQKWITYKKDMGYIGDEVDPVGCMDENDLLYNPNVLYELYGSCYNDPIFINNDDSWIWRFGLRVSSCDANSNELIGDLDNRSTICHNMDFNENLFFGITPYSIGDEVKYICTDTQSPGEIVINTCDSAVNTFICNGDENWNDVDIDRWNEFCSWNFDMNQDGGYECGLSLEYQCSRCGCTDASISTQSNTFPDVFGHCVDGTQPSENLNSGHGSCDTENGYRASNYMPKYTEINPYNVVEDGSCTYEYYYTLQDCYKAGCGSCQTIVGIPDLNIFIPSTDQFFSPGQYDTAFYFYPKSDNIMMTEIPSLSSGFSQIPLAQTPYVNMTGEVTSHTSEFYGVLDYKGQGWAGDQLSDTLIEISLQHASDMINNERFTQHTRDDDRSNCSIQIEYCGTQMSSYDPIPSCDGLFKDTIQFISSTENSYFMPSNPLCGTEEWQGVNTCEGLPSLYLAPYNLGDGFNDSAGCYLCDYLPREECTADNQYGCHDWNNWEQLISSHGKNSMMDLARNDLLRCCKGKGGEWQWFASAHYDPDKPVGWVELPIGYGDDYSHLYNNGDVSYFYLPKTYKPSNCAPPFGEGTEPCWSSGHLATNQNWKKWFKFTVGECAHASEPQILKTEGCMDYHACNYDPVATDHVSSQCTYPSAHNCYLDLDNDGLGDPLRPCGDIGYCFIANIIPNPTGEAITSIIPGGYNNYNQDQCEQWGFEWIEGPGVGLFNHSMPWCETNCPSGCVNNSDDIAGEYDPCEMVECFNATCGDNGILYTNPINGNGCCTFADEANGLCTAGTCHYLSEELCLSGCGGNEPWQSDACCNQRFCYDGDGDNLGEVADCNNDVCEIFACPSEVEYPWVQNCEDTDPECAADDAGEHHYDCEQVCNGSAFEAEHCSGVTICVGGTQYENLDAYGICGCMDETATNYNPEATWPGNCEYAAPEYCYVNSTIGAYVVESDYNDCMNNIMEWFEPGIDKECIGECTFYCANDSFSTYWELYDYEYLLPNEYNHPSCAHHFIGNQDPDNPMIQPAEYWGACANWGNTCCPVGNDWAGQSPYCIIPTEFGESTIGLFGQSISEYINEYECVILGGEWSCDAPWSFVTTCPANTIEVPIGNVIPTPSISYHSEWSIGLIREIMRNPSIPDHPTKYHKFKDQEFYKKLKQRINAKRAITPSITPQPGQGRERPIHGDSIAPLIPVNEIPSFPIDNDFTRWEHWTISHGVYYGCAEPTAPPSVEGCMDESACNYDQFATVESEYACYYPPNDCLDCDNNCLCDYDCAGLCGGGALIDNCGVCNGFNYSQDECGVCDGNNLSCDLDLHGPIVHDITYTVHHGQTEFGLGGNNYIPVDYAISINYKVDDPFHTRFNGCDPYADNAFYVGTAIRVRCYHEGAMYYEHNIIPGSGLPGSLNFNDALNPSHEYSTTSEVCGGYYDSPLTIELGVIYPRDFCLGDIVGESRWIGYEDMANEDDIYDGIYFNEIEILIDDPNAPVWGCTDPIACNFDAEADTDDGSCLYDNCNGDGEGYPNPWVKFAGEWQIEEGIVLGDLCGNPDECVSIRANTSDSSYPDNSAQNMVDGEWGGGVNTCAWTITSDNFNLQTYNYVWVECAEPDTGPTQTDYGYPNETLDTDLLIANGFDFSGPNRPYGCWSNGNIEGDCLQHAIGWCRLMGHENAYLVNAGDYVNYAFTLASNFPDLYGDLDSVLRCTNDTTPENYASTCGGYGYSALGDDVTWKVIRQITCS